MFLTVILGMPVGFLAPKILLEIYFEVFQFQLSGFGVGGSMFW
ncbi:hypothetical protein Pr1d_53630 [Bythopirellula goksoeyrii]|uniref:Uncharacterized protein n=1 Tax=Bythopirellula goksoeyrii TaxID=1400387 RepID=A0A5B9QKF2_9BACT|nr:hypothetical protein Pr1d_53630 [Bythopirellula goksoeyrii]